MVFATAAAIGFMRAGGERWLVACVAIAFASGGALLSSDAWMRARSSTLRQTFDEAAAVERAHADAEHRFMPEDPSAFAVVDGVLRADASPSLSGVSLSLDVNRIAPIAIPGTARDVSGGLLRTVGGALSVDRLNDWRAGRRVRLPVELRRPSRYLDAGVPDGERALLLRGTTLAGTAKSGALVELLSRGSWIDERLADVRAFSRRAIRETVGRWSAGSAAIVTAIVIGDRAGLDEGVQRSLQEAGTYHVIAISGGNIAILAGLLLGAFRLAGVLGRTAALMSMVVLIAYGALVGGGASVDRATLMAVVYFAARAADQRSPPLNTLALAAALLVAAQPFSVADPAFVLTFGATLAILFVAPAIPSVVPRRWIPAVSLLVASMATEAVLLPAGALFFSRVTFAGLALNFLAIPLMAVAQVAGMALVPLAVVSTRLAQAAGAVRLRRRRRPGVVGGTCPLRARPGISRRAAVVVGRRGVLHRARGVVAFSEEECLLRDLCVDRRVFRDLDPGSSRGRGSQPAAMDACAHRFSTSVRETRRFFACRTDRPCSSTPAAWPVRPPSTSATASSRPCCAMPASAGSTTSSSRTAIPITSAAPERSSRNFVHGRSGRAFRSRASSRSKC